MKRTNSRELLNSTLSSGLDIHIRILNLTSQNINETIEYLKKSPYLNEKLPLRKLLFMVNNLMICQPLRFPVFFELISNLLSTIERFFSSDELFNIFEMNKAILALLLDSKIVSIAHLDKNLDYYVDNQDHFFFFYREIEASSKRRYNEIIKANPEFVKFVKNHSSEESFQHHVKYRKSGLNHSKISSLIRNDDLENFQQIKNINLNNEIEHSIYEVTQFDVIFGAFPTLIEYSAFFQAVKIFNYLLNKKVTYDSTLMRYAVAGGNQKIIQILLEKGLSFDVKCLNTAIEFHQQVIIDLIRSGNIMMNTNNLIEYDFYSLSKAVESYNIQILIEILKNENISLVSDVNQWNILQIASGCGQLEVIRFVIEERGMDINSKNSLGKTSLILASENGFSDIVDYLLSFEEIEVNAGNDRGTALHYAVLNGHLSVIKLLCKHKDIDLNALNANAETPLFVACRHSFIDIIKYLVGLPKINLNARADCYHTPLLISCKYGILEVVRILCEAKNHSKKHSESNPNEQIENLIDFSMKNKRGLNAFMIAVSKGHLDVVKYLFSVLEKLNSSQVLNEKGKFGESSILLAAVSDSYFEVLKYLVEIGKFEVDSKNENGDTALHVSAKNGAIKNFQYLLQNVKKINPNEVNNAGKTAFELLSEESKQLLK
ncbi:hypothetical protein TRFO_29516 [Tritrichomonas foetus]|uniref:Uncharacterized protein n=1 Tax=Tritrichomonas foetus TaxID=1144522 RepID=A0A1J4K138_9EUKA|nr:hypothetical protein TRFO_29516 [Tritrichomonas foetus]|eukprot:OHT03205.1 hypothetical protein TRFO_29516 [Tritrichomonas foetus]